MNIYHPQLAAGRWQQLSLVTQLANIGSEVSRAIKWKNLSNEPFFQQAFERMLELIDLTVADPKNRKRLKEVLRAREMLVDYLMYDNVYHSTDEQWLKYFDAFAILSNNQRRLMHELQCHDQKSPHE